MNFEKQILANRDIMIGYFNSKLNYSYDASEEAVDKAIINIYDFIYKHPDIKIKYPLAFLRRCTYNEIVKEVKKVKEQYFDTDFFGIFIDDTAENPKEKFLKEYNKKIVNSTINTLPDYYKDIAVKFYLEEKTANKIAAETGLTLSSIRNKLDKIREKLKKKLQANLIMD